MLQFNQITKNFGPHTLFENLSLQVGERSRLGLIGRNGCGKSTLLKLMVGALEPDGGDIYRSPGLRINYLSQEPHLNPDNTLEAEMKSVFRELNAVVAEEAVLLTRLECLDGEARDSALNRLDFLHREMERLDARDVDAKIGRTLKGLGFPTEALQRRVSEYSGGWKMRVNLAKVLLEPADILLLDEPTNHLDLEACEWMEGFLKEYSGGLVVVSHDRRFLDQVTTEIAELELGKITVWTGNYTAHLQQKAERLELMSSAYERQQKELARQTAFVDRFRASATRSTQAKSREKQLAKIERLEPPKTDNNRMTVRFSPPMPSGRQVLTLRGVAKAFGENRLFSNLTADVQRNQRIFLLGANGCGKTTLLRLVLGLEKPDTGEIRQGHNVSLGYFSQNQLETLDPSLSLFDTLHSVRPRFTQSEVRGLLARFLFTGDQVFKPVSVLSGGEKSKLALAKLMVEGPNTLLLDEPTNHMDIPAKEVLADAFADYDGTLLCISHDRYFIQQLATHIWEIYEGRLLKYEGDYDYYLFKRDEVRAQALQSPQNRPAALTTQVAQTEASPPAPQKTAASPLQAKREAEKRLNKVEKAIMALETELAELDTHMSDPAVQQNYQELQSLSEVASLKHWELDALNQEWESLTDALSG